jgi:hypothetical protein
MSQHPKAAELESMKARRCGRRDINQLGMEVLRCYVRSFVCILLLILLPGLLFFSLLVWLLSCEILLHSIFDNFMTIYSFSY